MLTITGQVERVTYYNTETRYTVARLRAEDSGRPITIIGITAGLHPGEKLRVTGSWQEHPRYGQQLKIETAETCLPASVDGILAYLSSGLIAGIGPKTARRLVDYFAEDTLKMLDAAPGRLSEAPGVGEKTAARIADAWRDHHGLRQLMSFLQDHGVKLAHASRIYDLYGADAPSFLSADPYVLADDWPGAGFVIADTIARHMGTPADDPKRIVACLVHTLERFVAEGHVYAPDDELVSKCRELFGIDPVTAHSALAKMGKTGALAIEPLGEDGITQAVFPVRLYEAEIRIANRIKTLLGIPSSIPDPGVAYIRSEIVSRLAIQPSAEQLTVLESVLNHKVAIITGGPGTGKTTLIRSISELCRSLKLKLALAAPTGRAARRLSAVTGRDAFTVHRLLGFTPHEELPEKDRDDPVEADVIVVDEASMVDTLLMHYLVEAVPMMSTLILVGDAHQLPSVGPGSILEDMISSKTIKTFEFTEIFRQSMESAIVRNAHRVRRGQAPELSEPWNHDAPGDFYFIECQQPEKAVEAIVDLCTRRIPQHFNLDPAGDIQVLTPMHKGHVGTINLNRVLQSRLNPAAAEPAGVSIFRPGDKVIHTKNNYVKEVFNGDIGIVIDAELRSETLTVDYEGRAVTYLFSELEELSLAYAITVHKSQGSEYPCVVIALMTQHYPMLQRNLLYTAMTRGKRLVVIVGSQRALAVALENDRSGHRRSRLAERLSTPGTKGTLQ
ncbi:MAG: ATP-dependent RecD-like DNA helicase [Pseudomonadota bacterium]